MSSGITADSASKTSMFVALYAPVIDLRHLFCNNVAKLATSPVRFLRGSFGKCHTGAPYVIAGRTTAVYTCLALFNVAPHVEVAILVSHCLRRHFCLDFINMWAQSELAVDPETQDFELSFWRDLVCPQIYSCCHIEFFGVTCKMYKIILFRGKRGFMFPSPL